MRERGKEYGKSTENQRSLPRKGRKKTKIEKKDENEIRQKQEKKERNMLIISLTM